MAAEKFFIGVDVGTKSARAGLFTESGILRSHSRKDIEMWVNEGFADGSYEQSTDNIWEAVCHCVKVGAITLLSNGCFGTPTHTHSLTVCE